MLWLRRLCGSMPERCDQGELKPSVVATKPSRYRRWQDFPDLSPAWSNDKGYNRWDSWTDYFIANRRMRLRISAEMIRAGAVAARSTRDATTKQTRSTLRAP